MSLTTPESVWQLRETLRAKAKREPACRFHSLYDKIYRKDVLWHAWQCCRSNGGSAGVDGVSFEQIEAAGVNGWLEELTRELRERTCRPEAVRRVWIPKPGSTKQRPLGVPRIEPCAAGAAISASARSAEPVGLWTTTPGIGCVSG